MGYRLSTDLFEGEVCNACPPLLSRVLKKIFVEKNDAIQRASDQFLPCVDVAPRAAWQLSAYLGSMVREAGFSAA